MNNRTQQIFDRSIREALALTQAAKDRNHSAGKERAWRNADTSTQVPTMARPKGRLYLDPITGATVWDPSDQPSVSTNTPGPSELDSEN